jgi:hypothetical protein
VATRVGEVLTQEAVKLEDKIGQAIAPTAESVQQMAARVSQYAEKNWPKPPPVRMKPSPPLPARKIPPPPPIRPRADWHRP